MDRVERGRTAPVQSLQHSGAKKKFSDFDLARRRTRLSPAVPASKRDLEVGLPIARWTVEGWLGLGPGLPRHANCDPKGVPNQIWRVA